MLRASLCVVAIVAIVVIAAIPNDPPDKLSVQAPIQHGKLSIFPLSSRAVIDTSGFLTLDEGLTQGTVIVGELGVLRGSGAMMRPLPGQPAGLHANRRDNARGNELAIQNVSTKPLLLLAGELVSGGKQDRVVARDRIVAPHSEPLPLDVFCVEPGRWQGLSGAFASAKSMAHPLLRKQVVEAKNQQKVWDEVAQSRMAMSARVAEAPPADAAAPLARVIVGGAIREPALPGAALAAPPPPPPTTSYARVMSSGVIRDTIEGQLRTLFSKIPKGTLGVAVALNGRVMWTDVFASPTLFDRYKEKLLRSYVVEEMRAPVAAAAKMATVTEVEDFMRIRIGRQTIEVEPKLYRLVRTEADGTVTYELFSLSGADTALHVARMRQ